VARREGGVDRGGEPGLAAALVGEGEQADRGARQAARGSPAASSASQARR
jgi:hypothetical protein